MFDKDEVQAIVDRRVAQIVAFLRERSLGPAAYRVAAVFGDLPFHVDVPTGASNEVDSVGQIEET